MTTADFIRRYSIASRSLTGQCEGVTVHLCRVPGSGGRHFGGVTSKDEPAYVIKLEPRQVNGFISQTALAIYDAVRDKNKDAARRAA